MECPPFPLSCGRTLVTRVCIYTGDVGKRLGTYRVDEALIAEALACAAERGETVTDVIIQALQAYIRAHRTGGIAFAAPVGDPSVYTDVESPVSYDEPAEDLPCKHPAGQVDPDAGVCHECGADVW
jgi:hypothetical protein